MKVFPLREGSMDVLGLRYLLCGLVPAFRSFEKKGKRLETKDVVSYAGK